MFKHKTYKMLTRWCMAVGDCDLINYGRPTIEPRHTLNNDY